MSQWKNPTRKAGNKTSSRMNKVYICKIYENYITKPRFGTLKTFIKLNAKDKIRLENFITKMYFKKLKLD